MRTVLLVAIGSGFIIGCANTSATPGTAPKAGARLNPVVDLLAAKKPAFGLYAPANPRGGRGGGRGAAPAGGTGSATPPVVAPAPTKTTAELAKDAFDYKAGDYVFDGSMEGSARFDTAYSIFTAFSKGMADAGSIATASSKTITHPIFVKTPKFSADPKLGAERIAKQLNAGALGIVMVEVESAEEVKQGLAAMRFKSKGGTRPDDVGHAPALLGLSDKDYREKADVWPLNPNGELVNFTIVETDTGLAHVREIAAVKGIGVLFPGAGTLSGHFGCRGNVDPNSEACVAWENSIQRVLSACKEFKVPCGYPANDSTMMTRRMKEGFTVFITGWGETGFKAVEVGKRVGGR